jgi:hypothetical protein
MERLLDIQSVIYFRAKYSDLDDAKEYITMIKNALPFVARDNETDASEVYVRMKRDLRNIKDFVIDNP